MLVEPGSLCWVGGRMVEARDGPTWAVEFARFSALSGVVRDNGSGLGKGLKLERARVAPKDSRISRIRWTSFTRSARVAVPCGKPRRGQPRPGASRGGPEGVGPVGPCGRIADGPRHTDKPPVASGRGTLGSGDGRREGLEADPIRLRVLHARRPLQRSATGPSGCGGGVPHLSGPAWAKTRRLLLRRESFTFLDQAQRRLAELGLDPDVLSALLDLEGLQRQGLSQEGGFPGGSLWTIPLEMCSIVGELTPISIDGGSPMSTITQRIASAFVVLCGRYGDVTKMAHDREQSRQSLYREAGQVANAVDGTAVQSRIDELQRQLAGQQAQIQDLQERLEHAIEITRDKQDEFASVAQAEGVSLSVARRLLQVVAGSVTTPSVPTLGRATEEAGQRAGRCSKCSTRWPNPRSNRPPPTKFFGPKPVLMLVEPGSLCWVGGRMVEARDGPTWAVEFARFSASAASSGTMAAAWARG